MLHPDGSLRDLSNRPLEPKIEAEAIRIGGELRTNEPHYLERLRRFFAGEDLTPDYHPMPEDHPSYDPTLEQAFAPAPPAMVVRS